MWFEPYKGNKYFPGFYMYIRGKTCFCYTISYSKLACGIGKGWGARNGVWWYPKRLNLTFFAGPIESLLFFFFSFLSFFSFVFFFGLFNLAEEADGPDFEPELLVGVPKVSQHDVDDWNLIDFGSVNLHHSLSISTPRRTSI